MFLSVGHADKNIVINGVSDQIEQNIRSFLTTFEVACDAEDNLLDAFIEKIPEKNH